MKILGTKTIQMNEEQKDLLRNTASKDMEVRKEYRKALAQTLDGAFKAAVLEEDTLDGVFQRILIPNGADTRFPIHFLEPGDEEDHIAFVMPKEGAIPNRFIEGDEVYVGTYVIGNSIDWPIRYARDARWDVVADAMDVFHYGFTRKMNDDGWKTIISSAVTNGAITDSAATSGYFTKKLVTNLQTGMKRLNGGRRTQATDIFLSPEGLADIRNWTSTQVDPDTRREIFVGNDDGGIGSLFGVRLHELQDLGVGQRYQTYIESASGPNKSAWFPHPGDQEFCIALDLRSKPNYPFKMPVREELGVFDDETMHRSARMGVYGWMELGFTVLDSRYAAIGTF